MSPTMARLYLLQWEDNNAQVGYSFREVEKEKDGESTKDQAAETENLEKKIADFIRENDIEVPQLNKKLPELDEKECLTCILILKVLFKRSHSGCFLG